MNLLTEERTVSMDYQAGLGHTNAQIGPRSTYELLVIMGLLRITRLNPVRRYARPTREKRLQQLRRGALGPQH